MLRLSERAFLNCLLRGFLSDLSKYFEYWTSQIKSTKAFAIQNWGVCTLPALYCFFQHLYKRSDLLIAHWTSVATTACWEAHWHKIWLHDSIQMGRPDAMNDTVRVSSEHGLPSACNSMLTSWDTQCVSCLSAVQHTRIVQVHFVLSAILSSVEIARTNVDCFKLHRKVENCIIIMIIQFSKRVEDKVYDIHFIFNSFTLACSCTLHSIYNEHCMFYMIKFNHITARTPQWNDFAI